jgi:tetratricopeptide (TPR) repeat protein
MKSKLLFLILFLTFFCSAFSQNNLRNFRKANSAYRDSNYVEAQILYSKGATEDVRACFNLANTLYQQGDYAMADTLYQAALMSPNLNNREKADALHNRGNIAMNNENFEEAVKNFKESLKFDGTDADTKYNLTYALNKLKEQQQNQGQNQQQQDKNQQNQDKNQQQQNQQQQDQNKNQQQQNQQQQQQKMSKEDAERILKAVENREKETMDKKKKEKAVGTGRVEKDW